MIRICIATGTFFHPQETQISFHIKHLFGGCSSVVSEYQGHYDPIGIPHHIWMKERGTQKSASYKLSKLSQKVLNIAQHRTARVPRGQQRAAIVAFLQTQKPDVILAEFGNVALRIAPVANVVGIPMFSYFRGADASSQLKVPLRAAAYRRMMPRLHGVFAVSQFLLDELSQKGIQHPNSSVIPSGVNTDLFLPRDKEGNRFVIVGRLVEKKRPDITLGAFCAAAKERRDITLDVVGDGPMMDLCKAIVANHGMADQVHFHGALPHQSVCEFLRRANVFLQHSVRAKNGNTEGLPTAIQEAMSCGLAIISTRHAGIPEAVTEGVNGLLVDEGDADGFTDAIVTLAANPARAAEMGKTNRLKACAHYDNRALIKQVEAIIAAGLARG